MQLCSFDISKVKIAMQAREIKKEKEGERESERERKLSEEIDGFDI